MPNPEVQATPLQEMASVQLIRVVLDVPLDRSFDYVCTQTMQVGQRVLVPFGHSIKMGMVVELPDQSQIDADKLRTAIGPLETEDIAPLDERWRTLTQFAAQYYHRPLGEVMLPALPALLRKVPATTSAPSKRKTASTLTRIRKHQSKMLAQPQTVVAHPPPVLNQEQQAAVTAITAQNDFAVHALFGVTGSGKTEVYLHCVEHWLQQGHQVLMMVPEINLTPQLAQRVQARFADKTVVMLNSSMAEQDRAAGWLAAHEGQADIVLGTRLSIFTPMPRLGAIVVDEEHDASFKQQEGLRYSARDLAVWRAHQCQIPIVLGSATPSLETWHQITQGRYRLHELTQRADQAAQLPSISLIDTRTHKAQDGLSTPLIQALEQCLARQEQALLFINRRGYAPVLSCGQCGWVSKCKHCSAFMVFHRLGTSPNADNTGPQRLRTRSLLQCHHCGATQRTPLACPDCGNQDIDMVGRGTQRVEERLQELFSGARIERMDADSTSRKGSAQAVLDRMHAGQIDILVGTQMVAKGHDFKRLTVVGIINSDAALVSHDFRAAERMFAQLMQVSGRAGRAQLPGRVLIQTQYPEHTLYQQLLKQDVRGFLDQTLEQRIETALPPAGYLALLRAQSKHIEQTIEFLQQARQHGQALARQYGVTLYAPVPLRLMRKAGTERAQLLAECSHRAALQRFLHDWLALVQSHNQPQVSWHIEVDPYDF